MHSDIATKRDQMIDVCKRLNVARLDIFGSAARGLDFHPDRSDVDFLVSFGSTAKIDHYLDLEEALERILGRKVDLVDRHALETSRNYIRRRQILAQAEAVYVA